MERPAYPSDLSDREWQLLEPLLPPPKAGGRPITYPRREIINAIRYVLRTGCSWRMLPHDLPPWRIVFHYFRTWRKDGAWQRANGALHAALRQAQGRQTSPSAAIIDSQSVRTTEKGGPEVTTPPRR
jgi:transposase